jgi:hypothetical protein
MREDSSTQEGLSLQTKDPTYCYRPGYLDYPLRWYYCSVILYYSYYLAFLCCFVAPGKCGPAQRYDAAQPQRTPRGKGAVCSPSVGAGEPCLEHGGQHSGCTAQPHILLTIAPRTQWRRAPTLRPHPHGIPHAHSQRIEPLRTAVPHGTLDGILILMTVLRTVLLSIGPHRIPRRLRIIGKHK